MVFFSALVFAVLCAWIDGWFYRRSVRERITHARFLDYVNTLDSQALEQLRGHLRGLEQLRAVAAKVRESRQP